MRLKSLRLKDFKRHADLAVELAPGLTVIRGANEAGKSTVQRALEMALFRRATSTAAETSEMRPWGRADAAPEVELHFEHEGTAGHLHKVFAGAKGSARLEFDGNAHTDLVAIEEQMTAMTGLPSERFFRSTASIGHAELAGLDKDEGALRDRLHQSMSGADRGTWAAQRKLRDAVTRLHAEGSKNPGPIKQGREALAQLQAAADKGEADLAALERDRSAFAEARAQRELQDGRLETAQTNLETAERAVAARDRLTKAEAEYARYRRAAELREEIARAEASHPSATALPVLRSGVEGLRTLEYDISEQRAELATQPDPSGWQANVSAAPTWKPLGMATLALLVGAVAAFLTMPGLSGPIVAVALVMGAGLAGFLTLRRRARASQVRLENELRENEIARRLSGRSELEERLRQTERSRDSQLAALGMADLAAAEKLLTAEAEHVAGIERLRAEYRGHLGDTPEEWEDVAQLRDRWASSMDEARHVLAGMGAVGVDPDGHRQRADASLRAVRAERERAVAMEAGATARVESNEVDAEVVADTVERLALARTALAGHERRLRVYEAALNALNAAEQSTMKKAARFLEQRMGADVAIITDGRYRRVAVDENELALRVYAAEAEEWVPVEDLSQGTFDQIYLAARLGLVRQVTQDRRPPLVLDDPFISFDDDRAQRAVELLKKISRDHQIIYLTCSDRYDSVADRVVELPRPELRDLFVDDESESGQRQLFPPVPGQSERSPQAAPGRRSGRGPAPVPAATAAATPREPSDAPRTIRPSIWGVEQPT